MKKVFCKGMMATMIVSVATIMMACIGKNGGAAIDSTITDSIPTETENAPQAVSSQTVVIDVESLTPPKELLETMPYNKVLASLLEDLNMGKSSIIAHTRQTRPLVASNHPFFQSMYRAYADHRPFELSPEALWLLICQGFSLHVNNNAEELRHLFVDFEGKQTLMASGKGISLDNPNSPWERVFPQFTSQIAAYTGQELIDVLSADFSTSTPASRVASQITVMESMKAYFDYWMAICGIPHVILHGTPDDWQSVIDRTEFLRQYKLDWWVDEMLPVLRKIKLASEGEVDKAFWRDMFKEHELNGEGCGAAETLADGWIVKFYPYNNMDIHIWKNMPPDFFRNSLEGLYDGAKDLPPEISSVPVKFQDANGETTDLTLWAGFVGIAQDPETFALRPEIGWFITRQK